MFVHYIVFMPVCRCMCTPHKHTYIHIQSYTCARWHKHAHRLASCTQSSSSFCTGGPPQVNRCLHKCCRCVCARAHTLNIANATTHKLKQEHTPAHALSNTHASSHTHTHTQHRCWKEGHSRTGGRVWWLGAAARLSHWSSLSSTLRLP